MDCATRTRWPPLPSKLYLTHLAVDARGRRHAESGILRALDSLSENPQDRTAEVFRPHPQMDDAIGLVHPYDKAFPATTARTFGHEYHLRERGNLCSHLLRRRQVCSSFLMLLATHRDDSYPQSTTEPLHEHTSQAGGGPVTGPR
jgi:hypothetical protein